MVEIGFRRCHADYSVFIKRRAQRTTVLLVYVEDIVLTGDDGKSIKEGKMNNMSKQTEAEKP